MAKNKRKTLKTQQDVVHLARPSTPDAWLHRPSIKIIIDGLHPLWTFPMSASDKLTNNFNGLLRTIGHQLSYAQWYINKTNRYFKSPFLSIQWFIHSSQCARIIFIWGFSGGQFTTQIKTKHSKKTKKHLKSRSIFSRVSCMGHWE